MARTRSADAVVVRVRSGVLSLLLFAHAPQTATTHATMTTRRITDDAGRRSACEPALPQREATAAEDEHDPDRGEREARRTGERLLQPHWCAGCKLDVSVVVAALHAPYITAHPIWSVSVVWHEGWRSRAPRSLAPAFCALNTARTKARTPASTRPKPASRAASTFRLRVKGICCSHHRRPQPLQEPCPARRVLSRSTKNTGVLATN